MTAHERYELAVAPLREAYLRASIAADIAAKARDAALTAYMQIIDSAAAEYERDRASEAPRA